MTSSVLSRLLTSYGANMPTVAMGLFTATGIYYCGPSTHHELIADLLMVFTKSETQVGNKALYRLQRIGAGGTARTHYCVMLEHLKNGLAIAACYPDKDRHSKSMRRVFRQLSKACAKELEIRAEIAQEMSAVRADLRDLNAVS
jgi:hypothetical protein